MRIYESTETSNMQTNSLNGNHYAILYAKNSLKFKITCFLYGF